MRKNSMGGWILQPIIVALLAASSPAPGQTDRGFDSEGEVLLSANLNVPSNVVRPNRPTPLVVPLQWRGERLLQGHLHYTVSIANTGSPLFKMVSRELALDKVPRRLRTMLPAVSETHFRPGSLSIALKFIENGSGSEFDLGVFSQPMMQVNALPPTVAKSFDWAFEPILMSLYTAAVVSTRMDQNVILTESDRTWWAAFRPGLESQDAFWAPFRHAHNRGYLETRAPPDGSVIYAGSGRRWLSRSMGGSSPSSVLYPAFMTPTALPSSELELAGYDAVFLQHGVGCLSPAQRGSLARWVRSGGKVLLRQVGQERIVTEAFLSEVTAKGLPPALADAPVIIPAGLGKIMLVPVDYEAEKEEALPIPEGWLQEGSQDLTLYGEVISVPKYFFASDHLAAVDAFWKSCLQPAPRLSPGAFERLAPKGTETLPVPIILLCLAAFLLAAGPVDYFFLGLIRRRVLTWILYPIAAGLCAWAIVSATNNRRSVDNCGHWKIVTIDTDGAAMSEIVYQLHLAIHHSSIQLAEKDALVKFESSSSWSSIQFGGGPFVPVLQPGQSPTGWLVKGTYPNNYTSTSSLPKWTPQVTRTQRYFPDTVLPQIDWEQVNPWIAIEGAQNPNLESTRFAQSVVEWAAPLAPEGANIHCFSFFRGPETEAHLIPRDPLNHSRPAGERELCVPSLNLADDLACVALTVEDGNQFTTYVRLFLKPEEKEEP